MATHCGHGEHPTQMRGEGMTLQVLSGVDLGVGI